MACISINMYTVHASMPTPICVCGPIQHNAVFIYHISMFHIVNPETTWMTNMFSAGLDHHRLHCLHHRSKHRIVNIIDRYLCWLIFI
jgi:hypothetical protein